MLDYLIIGYGIAGALLAAELRRRGAAYAVVDRVPFESSSRVAAGIWAPLTGLHVARAPWAQQMLETAAEVYPELERSTDLKWYFPQRVFRVFKSPLQRERWLQHRGLPRGPEFLSAWLPPESFPACINAPRGGVEIFGGGRVDTQLMVDSLRRMEQRAGRLFEVEFEPEALHVSDERIAWGELTARHVVFCTGSSSLAGTPYDWVPFKSTRGDVLTVEAGCDLQEIYHGARFLAPAGEGTYRVGASYVHGETTARPGAPERMAIETDLKHMLRAPFKTIDHRAGLRPNTLDNVAVLGSLPYDRRILIFNGLGSKGVLQAPLLARLLLNFSMYGDALPPELDVARFLKRWIKSWRLHG